MKQKVKTNFFRIHNFLNLYSKFLTISISMVRLNDYRSIPSREEEIIIITCTFPLIPRNNFLCLVINIIDRSFLYISINMSKSMKNRYESKSKTISKLIIIHKSIFSQIKNKISLFNSTFIITN